MWKVPMRVGRAGLPVATTVVATTLPFSYAVRLCVASETTMSLPCAPGVGAGVGVGTTGRGVAVGGTGGGCAVALGADGGAASDGAGAAAGSVVGSSVATGPALENDAGAGDGPAAWVNSVLRKMPPMSPKRMKTLIVDPTLITARLVIAFPSCAIGRLH